jgi:5-formyltetrahydrofolate cyclo-ligase
MNSKTSLRRRFRAARRALSASEYERRSQLAAAAIKKLPAFKAGARIAL